VGEEIRRRFGRVTRRGDSEAVLRAGKRGEIEMAMEMMNVLYMQYEIEEEENRRKDGWTETQNRERHENSRRVSDE